MEGGKADELTDLLEEQGTGRVLWREIREISKKERICGVDERFAAAVRKRLLLGPGPLTRAAVFDAARRRIQSKSDVIKMKVAANHVFVIASAEGARFRTARLEAISASSADIRAHGVERLSACKYAKCALEASKFLGDKKLVTSLVMLAGGNSSISKDEEDEEPDYIKFLAIRTCCTMALLAPDVFEAATGGSRALVNAALDAATPSRLAKRCIHTLVGLAVADIDPTDIDQRYARKRRIDAVISLLCAFTKYSPHPEPPGFDIDKEDDDRPPIPNRRQRDHVELAARWAGGRRCLVTLLRSAHGLALLTTSSFGLCSLSPILKDSNIDPRCQAAILEALSQVIDPLCALHESGLISAHERHIIQEPDLPRNPGYYPQQQDAKTFKKNKYRLFVPTEIDPNLDEFDEETLRFPQKLEPSDVFDLRGDPSLAPKNYHRFPLPLLAPMIGHLCAALLSQGIVSSLGELAVMQDRAAVSDEAGVLWHRISRLLRCTIPSDVFNDWVVREPLRLIEAQKMGSWARRRGEILLSNLNDDVDISIKPRRYFIGDPYTDDVIKYLYTAVDRIPDPLESSNHVPVAGDLRQAQASSTGADDTHVTDKAPDTVPPLRENEANLGKKVCIDLMTLVGMRRASLRPWRDAIDEEFNPGTTSVTKGDDTLRSKMRPDIEDGDVFRNVRLHAEQMVGPKLEYDEKEFVSSVLDRSKVLANKDWRCWDFKKINEAVDLIRRGPSFQQHALLMDKRYFMEALRTKFLRRLGGFFRCGDPLEPAKAFFVNLAWTPDRLYYARIAHRLYSALIAAGDEALPFLSDDRRGNLVQSIAAQLITIAIDASRLMDQQRGSSLFSSPLSPAIIGDTDEIAMPPQSFGATESISAFLCYQPRSSMMSDVSVPPNTLLRRAQSSTEEKSSVTAVASSPTTTRSLFRGRGSPLSPMTRRMSFNAQSRSSQSPPTTSMASPGDARPRTSTTTLPDDRISDATVPVLVFDHDAILGGMARELLPILFRSIRSELGARLLMSPALILERLEPIGHIRGLEFLARAILCELPYDDDLIFAPRGVNKPHEFQDMDIDEIMDRVATACEQEEDGDENNIFFPDKKDESKESAATSRKEKLDSDISQSSPATTYEQTKLPASPTQKRSEKPPRPPLASPASTSSSSQKRTGEKKRFGLLGAIGKVFSKSSSQRQHQESATAAEAVGSENIMTDRYEYSIAARRLFESWFEAGSGSMQRFGLSLLRARLCTIQVVYELPEADIGSWELEVVTKIVFGERVSGSGAAARRASSTRASAESGVIPPSTCLHVDDDDSDSEDSDEDQESIWEACERRALRLAALEVLDEATIRRPEALALLSQRRNGQIVPPDLSHMPAADRIAIRLLAIIGDVNEHLMTTVETQVEEWLAQRGEAYLTHWYYLRSAALEPYGASAPSCTLAEFEAAEEELDQGSLLRKIRPPLSARKEIYAWTKNKVRVVDPTDSTGASSIASSTNNLGILRAIPVDARHLQDEAMRNKKKEAPRSHRIVAAASAHIRLEDSLSITKIGDRDDGLTSYDFDTDRVAPLIRAVHVPSDLEGYLGLPWNIEIARQGHGRKKLEAFLDLASELITHDNGTRLCATSEAFMYEDFFLLTLNSDETEVILHASVNVGACRLNLDDGGIYEISKRADDTYNASAWATVKLDAERIRAINQICGQKRGNKCCRVVLQDEDDRAAWYLEVIREKSDNPFIALRVCGLEFNLAVDSRIAAPSWEPHLLGELGKIEKGRELLSRLEVFSRLLKTAGLIGVNKNQIKMSVKQSKSAKQRAALVSIGHLGGSSYEAWKLLVVACEQIGIPPADRGENIDDEIYSGDGFVKPPDPKFGAIHIAETLADIALHDSDFVTRDTALAIIPLLCKLPRTSNVLNGIFAPMDTFRYIGWDAPGLTELGRWSSPVLLLPTNLVELFDRDTEPQHTSYLQHFLAAHFADRPQDNPLDPDNHAARAQFPPLAQPVTVIDRILEDVNHLVARISPKHTTEKIDSLKKHFSADPSLGSSLDLFAQVFSLVDTYSFDLDIRSFLMQLFWSLIEGPKAVDIWTDWLSGKQNSKTILDDAEDDCEFQESYDFFCNTAPQQHNQSYFKTDPLPPDEIDYENFLNDEDQRRLLKRFEIPQELIMPARLFDQNGNYI